MVRAELIAVVGESGTGKTRSVKGLDPKETFFITVSGKTMSFPGWKAMYSPYDMSTKKGNYFHAETYDILVPAQIGSQKSRGLLQHISDDLPHVKNIVLDDYQYLMGFEFLERAYEKGWDKFTEIGRHAYDVLKVSQRLRPNLKIFILCHEETVNRPLGGKQRKIKTIGEMLDKNITLEGMFTCVFFTHVVKEIGKESPTYFFATQTDGTTTAKSPEGMFDKFLIENDLGFVAKRIDAYNAG